MKLKSTMDATTSWLERLVRVNVLSAQIDSWIIFFGEVANPPVELQKTEDALRFARR